MESGEWEVGSGKWGMGNGLSVVTLSLPKGDEEQRTFFTPWFGKLTMTRAVVNEANENE